MVGVRRKIAIARFSLTWHLKNRYAYLIRNRSIRSYIKTHKTRKLNLGCWPYLMDSWLNTDLYGNETVVPLDLTKKFPIKTSSFHYIFLEHTIEHFTLAQAKEILKECYRILKPGGIVRLSTPDLLFLIELYQQNKSPIQKKYINWSSKTFPNELNTISDTMVINNFVRAWGHQFIYDFKTIKKLLETIGFTNTKRFKPGKSDDLNLANLESHWKSITKDFNDLESLVVEAVKSK